jgi:DNA recombination protein RmuC
MAMLLIGFLVGGAVGAVLGWLGSRGGTLQRITAAETLAAESERRRSALEASVDGIRADREELGKALAVAERDLSSRRAELDEQRRFLDTARADLENAFLALAAKALEGNSSAFLQLAEERFSRVKVEAEEALEKRKLAIASLLDPLGKSLQKLEAKASEMEQARESAYARLGAQVQQLLQETQRLQEKTVSLDTALRGTQVRGRWGEIALRNVVELSGMTEHCDFELQETLAGGSRPDLVVRLPGGRRIAVDAKAPLSAYLAAIEETVEGRRQEHLDQHVRDLRTHVRTLARREYAAALEGPVDLVVLFIPGDPFLAAAYGRDPQLQIEALEQRVLIATPTTLVALLRTVALYWQQESLAQNAEHIAKLARELYQRVGTFGEHFVQLGTRLSGAVRAYNRAVGSYRVRVAPLGRRLEELRVADAAAGRWNEAVEVKEIPRSWREAGTEGEGEGEGETLEPEGTLFSSLPAAEAVSERGSSAG